ncbi:MAG: TRAP transporter small permease [Alphaproteobacteria bacterium]
MTAQFVDDLPGIVQKLVRWAVALKSWFLVAGSIVMALTFFLVVILRYWLEMDLFAYEEWLLVLCFWLYFMGSALGTYEDSHISADLLRHQLKSPRARWVRDVVVHGIELTISLAVVYWSILMLYDEIAAYPYWQTTIALKIPFFVPRLSIFAGFAFMSIYSFLHLYVVFRSRPGSRDHDPHPDGEANS